MKLDVLLEGLNYEIKKGTTNKEINQINYDSRKIEKDDLFVCIKGFTTDGHDYVHKAIEKGASAIICEDDINVEDEVTVIKLKDTRKGLAILASNFYGNPKEKLKIIGVTGTNGKTTTAFMIKSILEAKGEKVGLIGTIANYIGKEKIETERTTPESLELHKLFDEMVQKGVKYCVMEVSSHSLELDRVYGMNFEVGIFTNLTRDHLDFHKTFENYYKAKFKLFTRSKVSIVNIDDDYGKRVIKDLESNENKDYLTYSINNEADIKVVNEICENMDTKFTILFDGETKEMILPIPGQYNVYNALGAIGAIKTLGFTLEDIANGIKNVVVPGRCERVCKDYKLPYEIIIDYAHTPDGLENVLSTAAEFTKGRLISVFGCGGDRDKVKRPQMGAIGTKLSDIAIITSDNPRTEEPDSIIDDIVDGLKEEYIRITNRKEAILKAIDIAKAGDVIVIAGKGHETYQILKEGKIHFDEREVIKDYLDEKVGK